MLERGPEHTPSLSPETAPGTLETLSWLTHVANDARKLLILLILHQAGPLNNTGILQHLEQLADAELDTERADINAFVKKNFYKVDAVKDTEITIPHPIGGSRTVPAYELTERAKRFGVPLAGAVLDWAKRNPEMPLIQIFGKSRGEDGTQSPLRRYYMLYDLVTAPENPKGPSAHAIATDYDVGSDRGKLMAATRLEDFGWATKETYFESNQRRFTIVNPSYETGRGKRSFENLKPGTQFLFKAFGEAVKVSDVWTVDDFFVFAAEKFPDVDPDTVHAARITMRNSLVGSTTTLRHTIKNESGAMYDTAGKIQLKPEFVKPVQELISIIDSFCTADSTILAQGYTHAAEIMADADTVRNLFVQATNASNRIGSNTDQVDAVVRDIIDESEGLQTKQDIRSQYIERTGRKITLSVVEESLARLLERDNIIQTEEIKSKHNHTRVYRFGSFAVATESNPQG